MRNYPYTKTLIAAVSGGQRDPLGAIEIFSVHFSAHNPPRMCYTAADSFVYPDPLSESAKKSQQRTGQVRAIWRGLSVSVG